MTVDDNRVLAFVSERCGVNFLPPVTCMGIERNGEIIGDFPIYIPSVAVTSVGQGGGSLAWIDEQGVMQMGPESAGSLPGPVCFQRGGTQPTATDAFAACGMIFAGFLIAVAAYVGGG